MRVQFDDKQRIEHLKSVISEHPVRELDENSKTKLQKMEVFIETYDQRWVDYIQRIPKHITQLSLHYMDYYSSFGLLIWQRFIYGADIEWSENTIDIISDLIEDHFIIPLKTVDWFTSQLYGNYDRVFSFDRSNFERKHLYIKAMAIYKVEIHRGRKSSYTYKRALEDANEKYNIISADDFNENFINIEQGFKTWRKNQLRK